MWRNFTKIYCYTKLIFMLSISKECWETFNQHPDKINILLNRTQVDLATSHVKTSIPNPGISLIHKEIQNVLKDYIFLENGEKKKKKKKKKKKRHGDKQNEKHICRLLLIQKGFINICSWYLFLKHQLNTSNETPSNTKPNTNNLSPLIFFKNQC
jgi:hypothetical protein